ncbi:hypothetical protein SH668x_002483 [Planctomicrobium sp. SH668]|uniref:hypothetical protein n=1 Tax=Planctomicrobium sp. SH668 TaxID=3448126 RepID=UPI003F5C2C2F
MQKQSHLSPIALRRFQTLFLALALLLSFGATRTLTAQDSDAAVPDKPVKADLIPVVIFNIASAERSLKDISNMFEYAGRPDMIEFVNTILQDHVRDLAGLDRTRPMGYMLFLEPSLPPRPRMVLYFPVADEAELVETLRKGPAPITEVEEHRYEIANPGQRSPTPLVFQDDFAYMFPNGETFLNEGLLPNPQTIASDLTQRYDVALSARMRGVPPLIREVLSSFLAQQFTAQLQQRDREPDAAYQMRRAHNQSASEGIQQFIRDAEIVTFGLDATEDGRNVVIEMDIKATPDSEYAEFLKAMPGTKSSFDALLSEGAPIQASISYNLDKREKKAAMGTLKAARLGLQKELGGVASDRLIDALQATVKDGHIDLFVQFLKQPSDHLVLLGGIKVTGGDAVGAAIRDLTVEIQGKNPTAKLVVNAHTYNGATLHKLLPEDNDDEGAIRVFGRLPDFYYGTDSQALWIGLGGDSVLTTMEGAIDKVHATPPSGDERTAAPMQISLHASEWLKFADEKDLEDPKLSLIKETLNAGNDKIRLEMVPTENGVRVSLIFADGFVKVLGGILGTVYDESQL